MSDYAEDGQGRMSQVHHGEKMLHGLLDNLATPSVRVGKKIFFINELLQQKSREYFIPKKFFQAQVSANHDTDILSLGYVVTRTPVGPFLAVLCLSSLTVWCHDTGRFHS